MQLRISSSPPSSLMLRPMQHLLRLMRSAWHQAWPPARSKAVQGRRARGTIDALSIGRVAASFRVSFVLSAAFSLALRDRPANATTPPPDLDTVAGLPAFELTALQPESTVLALAQTADGYMWFASPGSLYRYDGDRFDNFSPGFVPQLISGNPSALAATSDGSLWVGYAGDEGKGPGGLVRFRSSRWERLGADRGFDDEHVLTLLADAGRAVWIGTASGLWHLDVTGPAGERFRRIDSIHGPVTALAANIHGGDYWVGTRTGIGLLHAGHLQAGPQLGSVTALAQDSDGRVWVATTAGLRQVQGGSDAPIVEVDLLPNAEPMRHMDIRSLVRSGQGGMWIGTTRGLFRLSAGGLKRFGRADGLSDDYVRTMLRDREDNLWVGARAGGATVVRKRRLWNFDSRDGLPGSVSFGVLHAQDGSVWVAMDEGVARFADGAFVRKRLGTDAQPIQPRAIAQTKDGAIWIGTAGQGLLRWEGDHFRALTKQDGLPALAIRSLTPDDLGNLWIGWAEGGLSHLMVSNLHVEATLGVEQGLCDSVVTAGARDGHGGMWFATAKGTLAHLIGQRFACLGQAQGLPAAPASSVWEDSDGIVWAGFLQDGGLARISAGQARVFTEADGLFCDSISQIVDDGHGHLWTACGGGASRIAKDEFGARLNTGRLMQPTAYQIQDGMRAQECNEDASPSATLGADGSVWFATLLGVSVILDPDRLPQRPAPVPVVKSLTIDGQAVNPALPLVATANRAALALWVTAPTFLSPQRVEFRYRLDPFDRDWTRAGTRQILYTRVPPGHYEFRLEATDGAHPWTAATHTLSVLLTPPFYERPAFYALGVILIGALLLGLHQLRLRQLATRYEAVQGERARIARDLHDGLGQGFTAVGLHLEALSQSLPDTSSRVRGLLERTRLVLDHAHEEARRSIWNLRAQALGHTSLTEAVRTVVEQRRESSDGRGPQLAFDAALPRDHKADEESEIARHELPSIAQEALTNALRHSQAKTVTISLGGDAKNLWLTVRDDGVGFDEVDNLGKNGHFGILGMRERVRRTGGTITIKSSADSGTEVRVEIPRRIPREVTST